MANKGPSFAGPLSLGGWSSATVAPKAATAPVTESSFRPKPVGTGPASPFDYNPNGPVDANPAAFLERAKAAEAAAAASGDDYQRRLAQNMLIAAVMQNTPGDAAAKRAAAVASDAAFVARNPGAAPKITGELRNPFDRTTGVPGSVAISNQAFYDANKKSGSSSSGDSGDDGGDGLGPNPRVVQPRMTPLESLLASIYPEAAQPAAADPLADPRAAGKQPSVIDTILGNLGAGGGGSSGYVPGPSFSGPAVAAAPAGPSYGAQVASTIPGAPAFLASAINGVNAFNPYSQVPQQPVARGGGGFDPLIGISAISAEQRIQKAEQEKFRAEAEAKYRNSQLKRAEDKANADNLNRLRGFGNSGWSGPTGPTMPQY